MSVQGTSVDSLILHVLKLHWCLSETSSNAEVKIHPLLCRNEEEKDKLLPMTTYFEGKKRFYFGEKGHIYLGNGKICGFADCCFHCCFFHFYSLEVVGTMEKLHKLQQGSRI